MFSLIWIFVITGDSTSKWDDLFKVIQGEVKGYITCEKGESNWSEILYSKVEP